MEETFRVESPPPLCPPSALPCPAAPQIDPQQGAPLPLCPHRAAMGPLDRRDRAEVQLLEDMKRVKESRKAYFNVQGSQAPVHDHQRKMFVINGATVVPRSRLCSPQRSLVVDIRLCLLPSTG